MMLSATSALSDTPDPAGIEFFEKNIRPTLVTACYQCHSREAEKIKGGLVLDNRESFLKGGDSGPAIVPGDPDKSLLIKAIRYTDENLQMPPKGKKLSAEQISHLEAWVKMGAPDPRVSGTSAHPDPKSIAERARSHWAFLPLVQPAIPRVSNPRQVQNPIDAFVLAKLESHHLSFSPQADKRSLIRRATYGLIGLPPTASEVAAFVADKSPMAFERVIERLLASSHYGERWGRHWLDVARYADTKGYVFEEERRYPYAYTYRDYVINAFNQDLPYDRFIQQQIAADLLPLGDDKRALAALGYLTLGRRFVNNIHDIIDDRIDVVTRGMMGLTVSCARCHDHKYDPVPTRDYYSLYGVFASSTEPDEAPLLGSLENSKSKAYEDYLAEHRRRVEEKAVFRQTKEAEMAAHLREQAGEYLLVAAEAQNLTNSSEVEGLALKRKLDPGMVRRWMKSLEAWSKTNHPVFQPWFAFAALPETNFAAKALEVIAAITNRTEKPLNVLVAQEFATNPPASLKEVADRYGTLFMEVDKRWQESLTNQPSPALSDPAQEQLRQVLYAADAPANLPVAEFDRLYDVPTSQKLRALQRKIQELDGTHPGAPPRAMALVDRPKPHNTRVFLRGSSDQPGPEAPRQFLEVLSGPQRRPFEKGSGRLELAEAIADPRNPLTARVLVNRVWLQHFGAGLVHTPSDFGLRSEPPTHPQLLDYLAARFVQEGWSIKKLQRLIMLSNVYQQSSEDNPAGSRLDPQNELLWRMNRQRLDFEALRDTLLAVAGTLDTTAGGHPVDITTEPFALRRTVYGFIDRQNLPSLFRTFDFASPDSTSPQRFFTTVPQQALFLMNNSFVVQQAKQLVSTDEFLHLRSEKERVRYLYQAVFQRDPTFEELQLASQFQHSQLSLPLATEKPAWQFGFGEFDETERHTRNFALLPHFTGSQFQGGPVLPDPKLGWVMLDENGGHVGNDLQHAAIRRWLVAQAGKVTISGTLRHDSKQGDGVRGRIVSSLAGLLGQWSVHEKKTDTKIEKLPVKPGETIDFVTDCLNTVDNDSFAWQVSITFEPDPAQTETGGVKTWDSKTDFAEAARPQRKPLTAWQRYGQVLLLANELAFVD